MKVIAVPIWQRRFGPVSPAVQGMAFMLAAALAGTMMSAAIRYLSAGLHPFEIAFFRSLFGLIVLAPAFFRFGISHLATTRFWGHSLRGCVNAGSMMLFFLGVSMTPLAKVSALNFTGPLFITILAVLFLGEKIRARRITALLVGFAGTWIILRPGVVELDVGAMLILGATALGAVTMVMIKPLVRTDSILTITLYMSLFAVPVSFALALPVWQAPSVGQLAGLALIGALGSVVHLSMAQAVKVTEVTLLLPVDFTKLIWAAIFGYLVFAEVPDVATWAGGAVIFAAAGYIAWRERQLALGFARSRPTKGGDGFKTMPPI